VELGNLPGGAPARAQAISNDGRVICGGALVGGAYRAFRWSEESGMVALPEFPNNPRGSTAYSANEDGSVIVGSANDGVAVMWDSHGVHSIADVLAARGVELHGWAPQIAFGITPDGQTIVGSAALPTTGVRSAWIATLPNGTH